MSMTATLRRVQATELSRLQTHPEEVETFLGPGDSPLRVEEVKPRGLLGFLWRLVPITITQVAADPEPAPTSIREPGRVAEPVERVLDLDKAWHGLHFLFTGTAWDGVWPAGFLLQGGRALDEDDPGRIRALDPGEVQEVSVFLAALTPEELARRYDPVVMAAQEIYPEVIWTRSPEQGGGTTALGYLQESYRELLAFVRQASDEGDALLVWIA
jgi:hypothetical protein